jgi:hypothetical protein
VQVPLFLANIANIESKHEPVIRNQGYYPPSRTGCSFFPAAGKRNQKEPPLKAKKLKTKSVPLKIS